MPITSYQREPRMRASPRKRKDAVIEQVWDEVDRYLADQLIPSDPALAATLVANMAAKLRPQD